jgi:nitroreductase
MSQAQCLGKTPRQSQYVINPLLLHRWSPRATSGEEISDTELMRLFEAARWAPSSYNGQPWRFIYAKTNSENWDKLFNLMLDFNKSWAKNAAVLVVIISRKNFEHDGKPSVTHQFDAGAARENLALQGETQGLVTHGMQGFDYEKARRDLSIPAAFDVMAMVAIGKPAPKEILPTDVQQREQASDRKPLSEIIMEGQFKETSGNCD